MPKPKYETWFMEGKLKDGSHYIEVKDDYSDLEEKIKYYSAASPSSTEFISVLKLFEERNSRLKMVVPPRLAPSSEENPTSAMVMEVGALVQ